MKWPWHWFRRSRLVTTAGLEAENAELRELVREMYDWTHYKHTRWARRAAKALKITPTAGGNAVKKIIFVMFAMIFACLAFTQPKSKIPKQPPIEIYVGTNKDLRVTVPNISKADLAEIITSFLIDDAKAKTNFSALIGSASNVTLVLTTKIP